MSSKDYGYSLRPFIEKTHTQPEFSYKIKSNSYGFRGKEPNFHAGFKVLILGDSTGMGYGVGEGKNFCDLSQSHFNKKNVDVDIFNTSIAGYCGINQLKVLNKWIVDYRPNLAILLFHWTDTADKESLTVKDGYLVESSIPKLEYSIRRWLNIHSHLYCLIKRLYYIKLKKSNILEGQFWFLKTKVSDINFAASYIIKMKHVCDVNNARFLVIILPFIPYDEFIEYQRSKNILIEELKKNFIEFKDWALVLEDDKGKSLIYQVNKHLTEKGHLYFSKYLIEAIIGIMDINRHK